MNRCPIEYVPPAAEDIRAHARDVCDALLPGDLDPAERNEIFHGYSDFLLFTARIRARQLTQLAAFDSSSD